MLCGHAGAVTSVRSEGRIVVSGSLANAFARQHELRDVSWLASWDVSGVTDMAYCFFECTHLRDLSPLAGCDVSHVRDIGHCFENNACLLDADLAGWRLSSCEHPAALFRRCPCRTVRLSGDIPFKAFLMTEKTTRGIVRSMGSPIVEWQGGWGRHLVPLYQDYMQGELIPVHDVASGEWVAAPLPAGVISRAPGTWGIGTTALERLDHGRTWHVGSVRPLGPMPDPGLRLPDPAVVRLDEPPRGWSDDELRQDMGIQPA